MAVYLVFGVAATHDYLGWNRARWAAAAELHERWGVPKEEIDGGFEYNNLLESRKRFRTRWIHRPGIARNDRGPDPGPIVWPWHRLMLRDSKPRPGSTVAAARHRAGL